MNDFEQLKIIAAVSAAWYLYAREGLSLEFSDAAQDHADELECLLKSDLDRQVAFERYSSIEAIYSGEISEVVDKFVASIRDADNDSMAAEFALSVADSFYVSAEGIFSNEALKPYLHEAQRAVADIFTKHVDVDFYDNIEHQKQAFGDFGDLNSFVEWVRSEL